VDATEATELATRFGVQGFPTLKYFRGGAEAADYSGPRDAAGIEAWLRKRAGPATTAVSTAADVEAAVARAGAGGVVFLAFADSADAPFAATVAAAAGASEEGVWALSAGGADAALRGAYGVAAGEEALVALNSFPGQANVVHFAGDEAAAAADELAAWAAAQALPLVVVFSPDTAPKIFAGALKTHLLLFADDGEAHAPAVAALAAAAAANAAPVLFVRVPPTEDRVVSYFGIDAADMPAAVLVHMGDAGMKKYKHAGDVASAQAYADTVAAYVAGTLKPWLKSEPAPDAAANAAAPVRVITGGNFDADVVASGADVLLEIYAPWCGHCKALAPKYDALGAAVKAAGLDKLYIAKMDGTANEIDHPGVDVQVRVAHTQGPRREEMLDAPRAPPPLLLSLHSLAGLPHDPLLQGGRRRAHPVRRPARPARHGRLHQGARHARHRRAHGARRRRRRRARRRGGRGHVL
jgi:protein disulfide-isomerase A1